MLQMRSVEGSLCGRDRQSVYGVLARPQLFRNLAKGFLAGRPDGHVINVGCGLSHYFQWLDNGQATMTDADLEEALNTW
ncbi:hypothetical protein CDN99_12460 [Roseateles aquatilis]|uniref:Uncharacterized protein n=2 Tax=Roseateles aquatilis TaxID=431061 RepID=A0A246JEG5_9BURK|nr:hypothetical protein CDN99_12460 [Roseateles aquatilis]